MGTAFVRAIAGGRPWRLLASVFLSIDSLSTGLGVDGGSYLRKEGKGRLALQILPLVCARAVSLSVNNFAWR